MTGIHAGQPHLVSSHVGDDDVPLPQRLAQFGDDPLGLHRKALVGGRLLQFAEHGPAHPVMRAGQILAPVDPLGQDLEGVGDIPQDLAAGGVKAVDFRRGPVDVQNPPGALRIPQPGMIFDDIVADGQHQICGVEPAGDVIPGLQTHRRQGLGLGVGNAPLAHEGFGHADAGGGAEVRQGLAGAAADHAVTGQDQGAAGRPDQLGGFGQSLFGRIGGRG